MSSNDDLRSRAADPWDKERAWKVVVKLAETHLRLQVAHDRPLAAKFSKENAVGVVRCRYGLLSVVGVLRTCGAIIRALASARHHRSRLG
jgi:hypothetical protein